VVAVDTVAVIASIIVDIAFVVGGYIVKELDALLKPVVYGILVLYVDTSTVVVVAAVGVVVMGVGFLNGSALVPGLAFVFPSLDNLLNRMLAVRFDSTILSECSIDFWLYMECLVLR